MYGELTILSVQIRAKDSHVLPFTLEKVWLG